MLAQRRRRWASIKPALGHRLVFAGSRRLPSVPVSASYMGDNVDPLGGGGAGSLGVPPHAPNITTPALLNSGHGSRRRENRAMGGEIYDCL